MIYVDLLNAVIGPDDDLQLVGCRCLGRFGREAVGADHAEEVREETVARLVSLLHPLGVEAGLALAVDLTFDVNAALVLGDFLYGDTNFRGVNLV